MTYSEMSYAGPDIHGRTFTAHHFHHIAAWQDHKTRERRRKEVATRFARRRADRPRWAA